MISISLADYLPPPRSASAGPWVQVRVEEAPDVSGVPGAWVSLGVQALSPVDSDPAVPQTRLVTVENAAQTNGWYRLVWIDGDGVESDPTEPQQNVTEGMRPAVADIGAMLRSRTKVKGTGGTELGTFVNDGRTRPTASQVERLIDDALDEVQGKVGDVPAGTPLERRARSAVALYAAMLTELTFFPEQVQTDRSPYPQYERLYNARMKSLIAEAETGQPGGEGDGDSPAAAWWSFPEDAGGLVGWQTRW